MIISKQKEYQKHKGIIISGPTAAGKSDLALAMRELIPNLAIINADASQIYQEIPIISAQPSTEEQQLVPHYLYGYVPPTQLYSVADWAQQAEETIRTIGKFPVIVGGSGMYIKALLEGIAVIPPVEEERGAELYQKYGLEYLYNLLAERDPESYQRLKPQDKQRIIRAANVLLSTGQPLSYWQQAKKRSYLPEFEFLVYLILPDRQALYEKIDRRFDYMLENGALEEVENLLRYKLSMRYPIMKAHGIPEIAAFLRGEMSKEEAMRQAKRNIRHYAKRQFTWCKHQYPNPIIQNNNLLNQEVRQIITEYLN